MFCLWNWCLNRLRWSWAPRVFGESLLLFCIVDWTRSTLSATSCSASACASMSSKCLPKHFNLLWTGLRSDKSCWQTFFQLPLLVGTLFGRVDLYVHVMDCLNSFLKDCVVFMVISSILGNFFQQQFVPRSQPKKKYRQITTEIFSELVQ